MKNLLSTIFFTFASLIISVNISNAQSPVLNANNLPVIGKTNTTLPVDTTSIAPGASGENVSWDFSNLSIINGADPVKEKFINPGSTTNSTYFPEATIAVQNGDYLTYFNVKNDSLIYLGMAMPSINLVQAFSNTELRLTVPFSYNDSIKDTYQCEYVTSGFDFIRKGITTIKADGYGSLILPGKTYDNVLRIHTHRTNMDSSSVGAIWLTRDEYNFVIAGTQESLLKIVLNQTDSVQGGIQFDQDAKIVTINEKGITASDFDNELASKNELEIFPNPAKEITQIAFDSEKSANTQITIYNQLGQIVKTISSASISQGRNSISINTIDLKSGIYHVQLMTGTEKITKKLIIE